MGVVNWVIDMLASEDVIDLYFILSDLVDINQTEAELSETAHYNSKGTLQASGYTIHNGHVFDGNGNDLGPKGQFVG